jgi:16S rRNA (uracil1498-N3)-methyltransferase
MRLKISDEVVVFDGTGTEYVAVIKEVLPRFLSLEIIETRGPSNKEIYTTTLMQAIPKKEKMDYIVEKATELGVSSIVPVMTVRTIPDWNETKMTKAVERWRKISLEAAKQCGRLDIPKILPVTDFTASVKKYTDAVYDIRMIAALSDKAIKLKDALKDTRAGNIAIAIGPEGDFTPEETSLAVKSGFKIVNLGPRVLKSDTAGLAVLAIINYEYTS